MIRLLLFLSLITSAKMASALQLNGQSFNTSDNVFSKELKLSKTFDSTKWDVNAFLQEVEFRNETARVPTKTHRLDAGYFLKKSDEENLHLSIGGLFVDSPAEDISKFVGQLSYDKKMDQIHIFTTLDKRGLPEVQKSTGAVGAPLTETKLNIRTNYLLDPKVKLQGIITGGIVSDNNQFWSYDASTMYGISPSWPWIWVGYGVSGLFFENDRSGYWSPLKFYNHGPRADTSFPIFGAFSAIFGGNINYYNEDRTKGDGFLVSAGIQWGQYDGNNVRLMYTKIRSGQEQSPWIYEGLQASCTILNF